MSFEFSDSMSEVCDLRWDLRIVLTSSTVEKLSPFFVEKVSKDLDESLSFLIWAMFALRDWDEGDLGILRFCAEN